MAGRCGDTPPPFSLEEPSFNGWGANVENWRFQPEPGISVAQLGQLELRWAFGIPGVVAMFGQPTIAGGRVFIGGQNGHVYSLDMRLGCYFWDYTASTGVRTAITIARIGDRNVALFGDRRGHVYAVDAVTGETIWKVIADDAAAAQINGSPVLFEGRLYVPISVGDGSAAVDPKYQCCRGRGAIVALEAATGNELWKTYAVAESRPQGKNDAGTQLFGPSGASIWSSPTIDAKRRVLYAGTGDNHSAPATSTSDAVLALSLDSGEIGWSRQLLAGDMGNGACLAADKTNCPEPHGPDFDLGASANLVTLADGRRLLTIGQKSGIVWALDPDDGGRLVWQTRVGNGGPLGGVQWGARRRMVGSCTRQSPISRSSIWCSGSRSCSIQAKAADCTRLQQSRPERCCGVHRQRMPALPERTAAPPNRPLSPPPRTTCFPVRSTVTCAHTGPPTVGYCGTTTR
jgi:polyvinyl alcohol dehydrogenase (cytochrome)